MDEDITQKIERLEGENLCRHCFGRQFAKLGHGLENYERTWLIKNLDVSTKSDFQQKDAVPDDIDPGGSCHLCRGIFNDLDKHADLVLNSVQKYNPETFLIGVKPIPELKQEEESLWEVHPPTTAETLKTEVSRLLGKMLEDQADLKVDFDRPDVNPVLDLSQERVEVKVNSVLIYGKYSKYSRQIPQTTWHCRHCRGDGCDECDWTGKNYETSVQEIIQEPYLRESKAVEAKFHGGGREDVDARCLGKREFVLELIEPLNRRLELDDLAEEVNDSDQVEIFDVKKCEKDVIQEIKQKDADKRYRVVASLSDPVKKEDAQRLEKLSGKVLEQDTPKRVKHRRADKTRKRTVKDIEVINLEEESLELEIEAEAGTYIKEFVSSDEGRTQPSISEALGVKSNVEKLDVVEIEK